MRSRSREAAGSPSRRIRPATALTPRSSAKAYQAGELLLPGTADRDGHRVVQLDPGVRGERTVIAAGADAHAAPDAATPQHRLNGERSRQTKRFHPGLGSD